MRYPLLSTLVWLLVLLGAGCVTPSSYHSSSLRINAVPNRFTAELAALQAPKIEEELNRAFIADGRFTQETGLVLSIELTAFQPPRSAGTQPYADQLTSGYRFLPGIMVVSARWYDDRQTKLEEVEFAENIMPLPGEISTYASVNRAIDQLATRIRVYTVD